MKNKTQFVEQDETIQSELYLSETYICKTQKRLYVSKHTKRRKVERVINLDSIQSVSVDEGKEKRTPGPLMTGILLAGVSAFFANRENLKPVFLSLLCIGLFFTLIGIILRIPRYYSKLIISTNGHPIELSFEKVSGSKEEQLKRLVYSTLVHDSKQEITEPTYDASYEKNFTEIPVVQPKEKAQDSQEEGKAEENQDALAQEQAKTEPDNAVI